MVKKFTIPFASQGDANDIPDALQVDGKVSFTQGFSYDYERPYDDPQAKDIAREDMNGLFKAITSAVGELQTLGASEWSNAISYPKGAIVYFEKDLYISQADDNQSTPPQNWTSIKNIADDSLKKAANLSDLTNKATARSNLGLGSSATLNKTDVLGTSTSLVATQKLVNDTKINLESSKQDKLTFTGTGNVARMSEVDKKRNKTDNDFVGSLLALRRSAGDEAYVGLHATSDGRYTITRFSDAGDFHSFIPNKTGTIALTSDIPALSQSVGSSTTSVMSQKAVTDRLNSIESSHGLGYGQNWVDVTSERVAGTTYTNNTGKPIVLSVYSQTTHDQGKISVYIDNTLTFVNGGDWDNGAGTGGVTAIVPNGSTYRVTASPGVGKWSELR